MARVAGVDLPRNKRMEFALTYINGIGRHMHEPPQVMNYGPAGRGPRLSVGMVLAIEPMVNEGGPEVVIEDDGWTAVTKDGSLSAHFEHSVAITENGPLVLSRAQNG